MSVPLDLCFYCVLVLCVSVFNLLYCIMSFSLDEYTYNSHKLPPFLPCRLPLFVEVLSATLEFQPELKA